jgi:hypothetical protein
MSCITRGCRTHPGRRRRPRRPEVDRVRGPVADIADSGRHKGRCERHGGIRTFTTELDGPPDDDEPAKQPGENVADSANDAPSEPPHCARCRSPLTLSSDSASALRTV